MDKMITIGKSVYMETYAQFPLVLNRGSGRYVFDTQNKKYLDMVAGIAVNILGYGDPLLSEKLKSVVEDGLLHCSNFYWNPYAIAAAEKLSRLSGMERVFFCNSGTEANEAAIKLVRKYGSTQDPAKTDIITMEHSFHGRTYGSMTATGQPKYQEAFKPLVPGFSYAQFNDYESVKELVTSRTCAIFIEVVQGEGGVIPADPKFLKQVRELCNQHDILLVFDEVQCGLGRTGYSFAWQISNVKPDVMTLAKALGAGVPIGALVATGKAAQVFTPGDHAATFGGNLLASAAANCVLDRLADPTFLPHVTTVANRIRSALSKLQQTYVQLTEIRGIGLMVGVEMSIPVRPIIEACMEAGLLIASAGPNVLRFVPPLTITEEEIDTAMAILADVLAQLLS